MSPDRNGALLEVCALSACYAESEHHTLAPQLCTDLLALILPYQAQEGAKKYVLHW